MKTRTALLTLIAVILFGISSFAKTPNFDASLKKAKQAFDQKDFSILKPVLEDGYIVKGIPAGFEDIALEQFFAQVGSTKNYHIAKRAQEGTNTRLYVAFTLENGEVASFDFLLTEAGKFKEFNVLNTADIIQNDIETPLNKVLEAFNKKDAAILQSVLETGYIVKGVPAGYEGMALEQFFAQMPGANRYTIQNAATEGTNTRVYVAFEHADGQTLSYDFLITENGTFREFNVLNQAQITQE
jgi:hypothetical protein